MAEEKEKKDMTGYIIAGVIGVAFVGMQTMAKINTTNTANLPATNANVRSNAEAILRNANANQVALKSAVGLVRSEINRREKETFDYINKLDDERKHDTDELMKDVRDIRKILFDHINTPKAGHQ